MPRSLVRLLCGIDTGRLKLLVTTTFGVPVEKAQIAVVGVGPEHLVTASTNASGTATFVLPFGRYEIEVKLLGFVTRHERIGVYQASLNYRLGLVLGLPHGHDRAEIRGTVSPAVIKGSDLSVRLVCLYSGDLIENSVDQMGKFVMVGFAPGKYVLLLFDEDRVVGTQEVEVLGGIKNVNIPYLQRSKE